MIDNLSSCSENYFQKFDQYDIDKQKLLSGAEELIKDFRYLTNCPCYLVDYTNSSIPKACEMEIDGIIGKVNKSFDQIHGNFFWNKSKATEYYEFDYHDGIRAVALPILLKGKVFAFLVYGGFVIEGNHDENCKYDSIKIISEKRANRNINRAIKFASVLSNQISTTYELSLQIKRNEKASEELRLQKVFFENLFENSPEAIVILDNEGRAIRVNKEFENLFEYSKEEVLSNLINDLIVPDNFKEEGLKYTRQAILGHISEFTTVRQTKYGKQIHVQVTGKPIFMNNEKMAVYAIYRNLTEQVWQQKQEKIIYGISELLNSSISQLELVNKIGDLLQPVIGTGEMFLELISPTKRSLRSFTQKSSDYRNLSFSESLSFSVLRRRKKLNLDENQIKEIAEINKLVLAQSPKHWIGYPLIDGDLVLGVFGVRSLTNDTNLDTDTLKLLELVSVQLASGVSRKKRELELKTLNRSMEQSPASIIITNRDGDIEYVNPKFCQITGYTADEVIGKNPRILKSGFTPKEVYEQMWSHLVKGEEWNCEFLNVKKNKELFWERASFSAIKDEFGKITHYMATKEDITEHKKFEKDLLEAKNKAEESDRMKICFFG